MKSIRTENIIFDEMTEEEFEKMSDLIIEQNDIDYRTIQSQAFAELGLKQKKHFSGKRLTITLVAAAIGLSTIGVGAAATVSFQQAFGDVFTGESPEGVSNGTNLFVETNKQVNVDFLGVCGNSDSAYASVSVKKSDGSSFVPSLYVQDGQNTVINYDGNFFETYPDYDPTADKSPSAPGDYTTHWSVYCTPDNNFSFGDIVDPEYLGMGGIEYRLEDTNTIRAYISYNKLTNDLNGMKMLVRQLQGLNAYHTEEVIFQPADSNKEHKQICSDKIAAVKQRYPKEWAVFVNNPTWSDEGTDDEWEDICLIWREIRKTYQPLLKENQILMLDPNHPKAIAIAEKTPLPIEYNLSFNLNYQSTNRELAADADKYFDYTGKQDASVRFAVSSINADSFGISIMVHGQGDKRIDEAFADAFYGNGDDLFGETSWWDFSSIPYWVELDNGEQYKLMELSNSLKSNQEIQYRFIYADPKTNKYASLDPARIKAIYFDTVKVYG